MTAIRPALLVLEDGSVYEGRAVARGTRFGEVVFNTAMSGYQEILTDPSYRGQIVVMTQPHIGNYGMNAGNAESERIWVEGFIARQFTAVPSNFGSEGGLVADLQESRRAGARRHRHPGAGAQAPRARCAARCADDRAQRRRRRCVAEVREFPVMTGRALVDEVTCAAPLRAPGRCRGRGDLPSRGPRLRHQAQHPALALRARRPAHGAAGADAGRDVLALGVDGVVLSNGPGDPEPLVDVIATVRALVDSGLPTFGICLGHQLLGLAMGGRTFKLKFGHHGGNQPVVDLATRAVTITSQNHGFAVDPDVAPRGLRRDRGQPERRHGRGVRRHRPADAFGAVPPGGRPRPARRQPALRPLPRPRRRQPPHRAGVSGPLKDVSGEAPVPEPAAVQLPSNDAAPLGGPLLYALALRFLRGRGSRLLSSTAMAALAASTLGVTAMGVAMALMTGYRGDLQKKLVGANAAVLVYPPAELDRRESARRLAEAIRRLPEVTRVDRVAYVQGVMATGRREAEVTLRGAAPDAGCCSATAAQLAADADGIPGVVLGVDLAHDLGVAPGDRLRLVVVAMGERAPKFVYRTLRFAGTFSTGFSEFDREWAVAARETVAALAPDGMESLEVVRRRPRPRPGGRRGDPRAGPRRHAGDRLEGAQPRALRGARAAEGGALPAPRSDRPGVDLQRGVESRGAGARASAGPGRPRRPRPRAAAHALGLPALRRGAGGGRHARRAGARGGDLLGDEHLRARSRSARRSPRSTSCAPCRSS